MRRIIILTFILTLVIFSSCASPRANQDVSLGELVKSVMHKLDIDPSDVGILYHGDSEDEDYIYDDILLKIMFPPTQSPGGDIVYNMDLFDGYAIVQYAKAKPVMFEIGIFKLDKPEDTRDIIYRNNLGKIEMMCRERVARLKRTALEYSPELAFASEKANVYIFDNYIYYIIAENYRDAYAQVRAELTE